MTARCRIPSHTVGVCDLEWGHDGDMHENSGDVFRARDYDAEHRKRQEKRRKREEYKGDDT